MACSLDQLVGIVRAAGDTTRLRLLLLLLEVELTVSELIEIVGQSQPRVSRHLKLLCDAGLLERFKEGAWVFYRAADRGETAAFARTLSGLVEPLHDATLQADRQRLAKIRAARAETAAAYFKANAADWQRIRALHVPEPDVERAILDLIGTEKLRTILDAGTGTGRMLELLAPHCERGIGIDISPEMLGIARDRLARAGAAHCQVRLGDIYRLPVAGRGVDAVIFHQVLHFVDDPQAALREALRVLKPGGRVLIADFAPHDLEFLREEHAHRRLGFSDAEVKGWFAAAGLRPVAAKALEPKGGAKGSATDSPKDLQSLTVMVWLAEAPAQRGALTGAAP